MRRASSTPAGGIHLLEQAEQEDRQRARSIKTRFSSMLSPGGSGHRPIASVPARAGIGSRPILQDCGGSAASASARLSSITRRRVNGWLQRVSPIPVCSGQGRLAQGHRTAKRGDGRPPRPCAFLQVRVLTLSSAAEEISVVEGGSTSISCIYVHIYK
jgi:hypothetical protein